MKFLGNLFRFFIYSNLFIACCAVLMVFQTYGLLLNANPDIPFVLFVFFATITSYSFHWYLTPVLNTAPIAREKWLLAHRNIHAALFIIGIAGAGITGFFLLDHWQWLLLSAFITFLYSAPKIPHPYFRMLRKIALGKTIFLALVWMYVTTMLPLLISEQPWKTSFTLFSISRFFLIYAICILFDYRDRDYDKTIGIRSLITWLSEKGITLLFYVIADSFCLIGDRDDLLWFFFISDYSFTRARPNYRLVVSVCKTQFLRYIILFYSRWPHGIISFFDRPFIAQTFQILVILLSVNPAILFSFL